MNIPQLPVNGSCLCGAVQVCVTEQPLLTFACHCNDCKKLTASAFSLTAMFPTDSVSVTGELVIGGLRAEQREHNFCAKCLSFIFTRIKGADTRVNLRVSLLDDQTWFEPFVELMTDEKLSWASVPAMHSFSQKPKTIEELEALMLEYSKH